MSEGKPIHILVQDDDGNKLIDRKLTLFDGDRITVIHHDNILDEIEMIDGKIYKVI